MLDVLDVLRGLYEHEPSGLILGSTSDNTITGFFIRPSSRQLDFSSSGTVREPGKVLVEEETVTWTFSDKVPIQANIGRPPRYGRNWEELLDACMAGLQRSSNGQTERHKVPRKSDSCAETVGTLLSSSQWMGSVVIRHHWC